MFCYRQTTNISLWNSNLKAYYISLTHCFFGTAKSCLEKKLWQSEFFKIDADIQYMKWFLIMHDKTEVLEHFYHNQVFSMYLKDPVAYENRYIVRELIEHCHGWEKRHTEIKNIQANNMEKFNAHIGMHVVSILCLALVRLQNGVTENLISRGGLI